MKKLILPALSAAVLTIGCNSAGNVNVTKLNNSVDSLSYAAGVLLGDNAKSSSKELDSINNEIVKSAFAVAIDGNEALMNVEEAKKYMGEYFQKKQQVNIDNAVNEGKAFLEAFEQEEGVVSTDSGIRYKYLKKGNEGKKPSLNSQVRCTYKGTFTDGVEFDSSQEPITFRVNGVIRGWTELLLMMNEGDKLKAAIPYDMAYGERGNRGIPPYSTLVFEMELVEIVD